MQIKGGPESGEDPDMLLSELLKPMGEIISGIGRRGVKMEKDKQEG